MNLTSASVGGRTPRNAPMSSRVRHRLAAGPGGGALFVFEQGGEDGVGELAAEQAQRFGAGLAAGFGLGDVVAAASDPAGLGDGDHVQGAVDAPVAAPVEPDLAPGITRPDRDRCGAGEPGIGGAGTEPAGAGGLADDDGSAQDP